MRLKELIFKIKDWKNKNPKTELYEKISYKVCGINRYRSKYNICPYNLDDWSWEFDNYFKIKISLYGNPIIWVSCDMDKWVEENKERLNNLNISSGDYHSLFWTKDRQIILEYLRNWLTIPLNMDKEQLRKYFDKKIQDAITPITALEKMMVQYNCSKKDAVKELKWYIQKKWFHLYSYDEIKHEELVIRKICKKFNIELLDSWISLSQVIKLVNKGIKNTKVDYMPTVRDMLDDFDGDVDELETKYYSYFQENVHYI